MIPLENYYSKRRNRKVQKCQDLIFGAVFLYYSIIIEFLVLSFKFINQALRLGIIMAKNAKNFAPEGLNFILITNAPVEHKYPNRKDVYEQVIIIRIQEYVFFMLIFR